MSKKRNNSFLKGFTLLEIIVTIAILSIAAMLAIPMLGSAGVSQVKAAADMIASDIEYAKSMAIRSQKSYTIEFDAGSESYQIELTTGGVIDHPLKPGTDFIVTFGVGSFGNVDMSGVDFGGGSTVSFNYLGSPDNGGRVVVSDGSYSLNVDVEPVTGYVRISQ